MFFNIPHLYLKQSKKGSNNYSIVLTKNTIYYTTLHFRFSSIFYLTQLADIFSYEVPKDNSLTYKLTGSKNTTDSYVVYNFHNLLFQDRISLFAIDSFGSNYGNSLNSISELYPNSSWLEREVAELNGVNFLNKKDLRNLMLQYGDTTTPFQKSSPSIGFKETYYDSVSDVLLEAPITLQV